MASLGVFWFTDPRRVSDVYIRSLNKCRDSADVCESKQKERGGEGKPTVEYSVVESQLLRDIPRRKKHMHRGPQSLAWRTRPLRMSGLLGKG